MFSARCQKWFLAGKDDERAALGDLVDLFWQMQMAANAIYCFYRAKKLQRYQFSIQKGLRGTQHICILAVETLSNRLMLFMIVTS